MTDCDCQKQLTEDKLPRDPHEDQALNALVDHTTKLKIWVIFHADQVVNQISD